MKFLIPLGIFTFLGFTHASQASPPSIYQPLASSYLLTANTIYPFKELFIVDDQNTIHQAQIKFSDYDENIFSLIHQTTPVFNHDMMSKIKL